MRLPNRPHSHVADYMCIYWGNRLLRIRLWQENFLIWRKKRWPRWSNCRQCCRKTAKLYNCTIAIPKIMTNFPGLCTNYKLKLQNPLTKLTGYNKANTVCRSVFEKTFDNKVKFNSFSIAQADKKAAKQSKKLFSKISVSMLRHQFL